MLDPNVKMHSLNLAHWRRLSELAFFNDNARRLFLTHDHSTPLKLFDTEKGELPLPAQKVEDAGALAQSLFEANPGVREVQVVDSADLARHLSTLHAQPDLNQDIDAFLAQTREGLLAAPGLAVFPRREFLFYGLPILRLAKFVEHIPEKPCVFVLAVFEGQEIWASLLAHFEGRKIKEITTFDVLPPEELASVHGLENAPFLLSLVSNTCQKPAFGWLVGKEDFEAYMKAPDAGEKGEIFQKGIIEKRAIFDCAAITPGQS